MSELSVRPDQLSAQNPWPGLRAFGESDREFFLGRERESAELLSLVQRKPVVVLYGQSGLGKTSLLQAGLVPELKRLDFLPIRLRFDHADGARPLAEQIQLAISTELKRPGITAPAPEPTETLWEYFHRRDVDFWGPSNRLLTPVVVLDQFEEVFTLGRRSEEATRRVARFAVELEALLEHRPPDAVRERLEAQPDEASRYDLQRQAVKFVISLREDFLPELDPWRARMPSLLQSRFRLERMTGAQALEVVERGGRELVDSNVARDIVDFVSTSQRKVVSHALEQRDVEPALLSVVCDELNRRRILRHDSKISPTWNKRSPTSTALAIGDLTDERQEIIQKFYEDAFDKIDPRVRAWVEDQLLTGSGYRDRAALEDATKQGLRESDFDLLVDRRILHRDERPGVVWLELTHDLLSDPASHSRTARERRRDAEAAAQRAEAEKAQLRARAARARARNRTTAVVAILFMVFGIYGTLAARAARHAQKVALRLQRHDSVMAAQNSKLADSLQGVLRTHEEDDAKVRALSAVDAQRLREMTALVAVDSQRLREMTFMEEWSDDYKRLFGKARTRQAAGDSTLRLFTAVFGDRLKRAETEAGRVSVIQGILCRTLSGKPDSAAAVALRRLTESIETALSESRWCEQAVAR